MAQNVLKGVDGAITNAEPQLLKFVQDGMEQTKKIAEAFEDDENAKQIVDELRNVMLDYASMERDVKQFCSAAHSSLDRFKVQYVMNDDEEGEGEAAAATPDLYSMFEERINALQEHNSNEDLNNNKAVKDFTKTVWNLHHGAATSAANVGKIDDEVEISQVDDGMKFICPITKTELVDPVMNAMCKHTYSREAIEMHIRSMKGRAKCPIPGCKSKEVITKENLESNAVLAFEIRKRNKKM